jgi:hypothetical protein
VLISSVASSLAEASAPPGTWAGFWTSLAATGLGAVLAFDVRGIATTLHKNNSEFTPWGKKLQTSQWPNPARIVGWCFLVPGGVVLVLNIVIGAVTLLRS